MSKPDIFLIFLIAIILSLASCDYRASIEGELYFKLIDFGQFKSLKNEDNISYIKYYDTLQNKNALSPKESELYQLITLMNSNHMSDYCNFYMISKSGEILLVFAEEEQFKKVRAYKLSDLQGINKKVVVTVRGQRLRENIIKATEITSLTLREGEAQWEK